MNKVKQKFYFRRYDVIVSKLDHDEVPDRDPGTYTNDDIRENPGTYTNDDIRENVDGLYAAIRGTGAPRKGTEVVIGDDISYRRRRSVDGQSLHFKTTFI